MRWRQDLSSITYFSQVCFLANTLKYLKKNKDLINDPLLISPSDKTVPYGIHAECLSDSQVTQSDLRTR